MAHVIKDKEDFDAQIGKAEEKLVIVCISASGCPQCDGMEGKLNKLTQAYEDCVFLLIDADETNVADEWNVFEYPVFHFYRGTEKVGDERGDGTDDLDAIKNKIETLRQYFYG